MRGETPRRAARSARVRGHQPQHRRPKPAADPSRPVDACYRLSDGRLRSAGAEDSRVAKAAQGGLRGRLCRE
eukprot:12020941-Alexandrium_andersonii.AAC.1